MTDARKMAEEALAKWDALPSGDVDDLAAWDVARDGMELFRALLAETAPPDGAEVARLTALLRECNAVCLCGCPESEHESYGEDGESCGHDDHECIRVAPAALEIVQRYRVALSDALAQKPASAEVREAAERLHPYADWHEDDGTVLWYAVPVEEPPYCGEPLCSDWPKEWNAPYDTVTGAFIDGPYTGKVLMWQRLPELPPLSALRGGQKGGA